MNNQKRKIEVVPKRMDKHLIRKKLTVINYLSALFIGLVLMIIIFALTL